MSAGWASGWSTRPRLATRPCSSSMTTVLTRSLRRPGGRCGVTSTNPIAFGIPLSNGQIFSADMSTAAIALGKVERAKRAGMAVPPECIQDAAGAPTRNPEALFAIPGRSNSSYGRRARIQRVCAVHFRRSSCGRSVRRSGAASRAGHQGRELRDDRPFGIRNSFQGSIT